MVVRHLPAAALCTNDVPLERGKATIPLAGIDIPFHSRMLRGEIQHYRDYLRSKVHVESIRVNEFVDRWIPNVTGKPFSLDKEYVQHAQQVMNSEPLGRLLEVMG